MNDKYFYLVAKENMENSGIYISSELYLSSDMLEAFRNILVELHKGDYKNSPLKQVVRFACREFNERFFGYYLKPYVIPIEDTIFF